MFVFLTFSVKDNGSARFTFVMELGQINQIIIGKSIMAAV